MSQPKMAHHGHGHDHGAEHDGKPHHHEEDVGSVTLQLKLPISVARRK